MVAPAVVIVSVREPELNDAVALGAPVPGVVKETVGALKRHPVCVPDARSGITNSIVPLACTCPAVVKMTTASCKNPGVSVLVSNSAAVKVPAVIWSVAMVDGPSMVLLFASWVVATTAFTPTIEDGVRTFETVNTCCVDCAIVALNDVMVASRELALKDAVAMSPPDEGVVKTILGDSKLHGACKELEARSGIVSLMNPPDCTRPVIVSVTTAVSTNPGVSVPVSNDADASAPATI